MKRTGRFIASNDFEVLERGEIRELGGKGCRDSREGQLSTGTRGRVSRVLIIRSCEILTRTRHDQCRRSARQSKYRT